MSQSKDYHQGWWDGFFVAIVAMLVGSLIVAALRDLS